jgi:MOSC domain-containing protein YiiM
LTVWKGVEKKGNDAMTVDSKTPGDASRYRSYAELEQALQALPSAPESKGQIALLMRRAEGGQREIVSAIALVPDGGLPGDAWGRAAERNPDAQITAMQRDVAELIANGQPLTLFGDNLILDLDLSARNLPPGSRLRAGGAILEVTPKPHTGCSKFQSRFGADALRFISKADLRRRNLRGIYLRVVQGGEVRRGDAVEVIFRAARRDS